MAKDKPVYETVKEFNSLAHKIVDKHPEIFYGIEVDKVRCKQVTNKKRPEDKKDLWSIKAVPSIMEDDIPYTWYAEIFESDWEEMDEKRRLILVASILYSVPRDGENKVIVKDVKDYGVMLRTFGVDRLEDPEIPHILNDKIDWINK